MPGSSATQTRNPVLDVLGRVFEAGLNRALALDAAAVEKIRALEGRSVRVDLRHLQLAMQLTARAGRFEVGPAGEQADLTLKASPGGLLALAMARGEERPIGKIEIAGDAELARRVEQLMRGFDPDWEAPLVQVFGEIAGHQIAKALRGAFAGAQRAASGLAGDVVDYVREESGGVVARGEAEQFYDDVDHLREAADRLDARIRRLAESVDSARGGHQA